MEIFGLELSDTEGSDEADGGREGAEDGELPVSDGTKAL